MSDGDNLHPEIYRRMQYDLCYKQFEDEGRTDDALVRWNHCTKRVDHLVAMAERERDQHAYEVSLAQVRMSKYQAEQHRT